MAACRIDRERVSVFSPFPQAAVPSESSSSGPSQSHYVVVREDFPGRGVLAAHVCHAAGESGPAPPGTRAVVLGVENESELVRIAGRLDVLRVPYTLIREDAGPFSGQCTAIGIRPTSDCAAIRKAVSSLPLVK